MTHTVKSFIAPFVLFHLTLFLSKNKSQRGVGLLYNLNQDCVQSQHSSHLIIIMFKQPYDAFVPQIL